MKTAESPAYNMKWFRNPDLNTNATIGFLISGNSELMSYIPEKANFKELPKSFLFTLIYEVAPDLYMRMMKETADRIRLKNFKRLEEAKLQVDSGYLQLFDRISDTDVNLLIKQFRLPAQN